MSSWIILLFILVYLFLLFGIALWAEKYPRHKWLNNPTIYSLGLAVYCTAWTYYGSIGMAATSGLNYLTIYLGPIIIAPSFIWILQKIIKIAKFNHATGIADFISIRYGNSRSVGFWVTATCLIAIVPYISLQLKAISESFHVLNHSQVQSYIFDDFAFYIAVLVAVFAAFFGNKNPEVQLHRPGIIAVIAFESAFKLIVFLIAGTVISFFVFSGFDDIYQKAVSLPDFQKLNTINDLSNGVNWFFLTILSMFAIFLLPRQFHMSVIENHYSKDLKSAAWQFPLYLLLFNLFVFPIAWGGNYLFQNQTINPDNYILSIPLLKNYNVLSILIFLGGISASISMILISSLALSNMLTNNILIPYGLLPFLKSNNEKINNRKIIFIRQLSIFSLIISAYILYKIWGFNIPLVSIGLIAFVIIAQLAPSFFLGLFWTKGNAKGTVAGIVAGLIIALILVVNKEPDSIFYPLVHLLSSTELDFIPNVFFWSVLTNLLLYIFISLHIKMNYRERNQAEVFVNVKDYEKLKEQAFIWRGTALKEDIIGLLNQFIGEKRTEQAMRIFNQRYSSESDSDLADSNLIKFAENLLTGTIGAASARILLSKISLEEELGITDLINVLEETKQTTILNKKLEHQSEELQKLTFQLEAANRDLKQYDLQKDEFLNTVAHELKTPITSIRLTSEVLEDEEMPLELRKEFLGNIINEVDRLSRLINDILDIEKISHGREKLYLKKQNISETIYQAVKYFRPQLQQKNVLLNYHYSQNIEAYYDEDRILQVINNLISNALKFVDMDTGIIDIKISVAQKQIKMEVQDNGKGINPEDMELIFDRFYQIKNQNLKKPVGSGLGLAICKYIIEAHKGTIIASNSKDLGGAKFTITLPKY